MFAYIITKRLNEVLNDIIDQEQTRKAQVMWNNLSILREILHKAEERNWKNYNPKEKVRTEHTHMCLKFCTVCSVDLHTNLDSNYIHLACT